MTRVAAGAAPGAVVGLLVSVAAAALLVATVDLAPAARLLGSADLVWMLPAIIVLAIQAVVRAARWALLVGATTDRRPPFTRTLAPMLVGYLMNATLPGRLGEAARTVILARNERLGVGRTAASVVVERVVDLGALLLLAAVALGVAGSDGAWPIGAAGAGVMVVALLGRRAPVLARLVPRRAPRRLAAFLTDLLGSIARVPRSTLVTAGLVSAVAWLADASLVWLAGRALGIEVPLAAAVAIGLGGAVGTAVPAAPGYLATYELGAVGFGAFAGMAPEAVLPLAICVHLIGVGGLALAGAVALGRVGGSVALDTLRRGSGGALTREAGP